MNQTYAPTLGKVRSWDAALHHSGGSRTAASRRREAMNRVIEDLPDGVLRPYRDHHLDPLEVRFGREQKTGRMTA
jgi:hypothetical protein